jgi:hypothetical protein
MDTPDLDRMTILERAQQLYDSTLRRHGDMLDTHAEHLASHAVAMAELRSIQERQERLMETLTQLHVQHGDRVDTLQRLHEERMEKLQQTLDAIKDMLERGNGHSPS